MLFATHAPCVFATGVEHGGQHRVVTERRLVHADSLFGNLEHANAFHAAWGTGEVFVDGVAVQPDRFEQLRATVAHVGTHAHLGHDLGQTLADSLDVVVDGLFRTQITRQILVDAGQRFHREIGVYSLCAVTGQHGEVMHFACRARFHHQTGRGAKTFTYQVLMNG